MTLKLRFGVNDIPYGTAYQTVARKRAGKPPSAAMSRVTTGDVADFIERRYHLMERYCEMRRDFIGQVLAEAMRSKVEALHMGRGPQPGPLLGTTDLADIAEDFRRTLDDRGFDGLVTGVPTAAAQAGVNHRLLHPYAKSNPPRPSFIDTGLYQANMRVWVD